MRFDSDDVTKPGHSSQSDNLKNIFGNILPSAFKTSELERKYDYLNDRLETQLRILVPTIFENPRKIPLHHKNEPKKVKSIIVLMRHVTLQW